MASSIILQNHEHGSYHRETESSIFSTDPLLPDTFIRSGYFETDEELHQQQSDFPSKKLKKCDEGEKKLEGVGSTPKGISRAVLAGKYLVQFEDKLMERQPESGGNGISCNKQQNTPPVQLVPTKAPLKCWKLATKELMQCKITARNDRGVSVLAAHERLGECSDFVNPISELIVTPKYFCLISPMTYGNVHSYIYSKSKLKETEAKNLFKQMVSTVELCHSKGIILRDLKMGRFVFADQERTILKLDSLEDVVILPKPDSEDDGLHDHHGCPNYVSPEKAESVMKSGAKYSGKSSDVWALGISLYAMLAGQYPFNDNECHRLLHKIRSSHYKMPEGISPFAKSLIRCLLVKNPRDRPSCKQLLTHPWFRMNDVQCAPSAPVVRTHPRDEMEGEYKPKRMRLNDDQVVPGSI